MYGYRNFIEFCLTLPGVYIDYPFGDTPLCLKVGGKLMAVFYLQNEENAMITLKCDPEVGDFLCQVYAGRVKPGYHFPKVSRKNWISIYEAGPPDEEIQSLLNSAYKLVVEGLPTSKRPAVHETGNPAQP